MSGLPRDPRITGGLPTQLITGFSDLGRQATNPQWQFPKVYNPKVNQARQQRGTQVRGVQPVQQDQLHGTQRQSQRPGLRHNHADLRPRQLQLGVKVNF